MRKSGYYLAILFALTTAVAIVFAVRAHLRATDLQSEVDKAAQDKTEQDKLLAEARRHARDLEAQLAAAREHPGRDGHSEGALAASADAAPAQPGRGGRRNGGDPRRNFMALMDNPEVAKLWTAQQRAQLDGPYASLFKNLKLGPADLEKFKNLLVEKQNSFRDVMSAARSQGLDPRQNRDEFRQLVTQANAEIDTNIQSMLGPDGFTQYKQYEQTLPQRNLVSQLDQRLSYSATPLNPSQSEQLLQILSQTAPPRQTDAMPALRPNAGPARAPITEEAIAQASSVLTPAQVTVLQQLQAEQEAQRKLYQSLRNPGGSAAPGGGAPAPGPTPKPAG